MCACPSACCRRERAVDLASHADFNGLEGHQCACMRSRARSCVQTHIYASVNMFLGATRMRSAINSLHGLSAQAVSARSFSSASSRPSVATPFYTNKRVQRVDTWKRTTTITTITTSTTPTRQTTNHTRYGQNGKTRIPMRTLLCHHHGTNV